MALWPVEQSWTRDVSAEDLITENKSSSFKASPGLFLPVMIDLYAGEAVEQPQGTSFEDVRAYISRQLIGEIMLRALVVNDHGKVVFEQDSRIYV